MVIRKLKNNDFNKVMDIAISLSPSWFDSYAIKKEIPLDLKIHRTFVVEDNNKLIAFLCYSSEDGLFKITWLGVSPKYHRLGIGTNLIKELEKIAKKFKVNQITVETLSDKEIFEPYIQTRNFYKKIGFRFDSDRQIISKESGEKFYLSKYIKNI